MKPILCTALLLLSTSLNAQVKVIYGEDNREDVFASNNPAFVEYARATAAKIPNIMMHAYGRDTIFRTASLAERGVCAKERFSHQPTSAMCTGFLVAENLLVTAGHCVTDWKDCQSSQWAFDYKVDTADQSKIILPTKKIYACKKIVARAFDQEGTGPDYAVIELKKSVTDRRPLAFRRSGTVEVGTPLAVIGHPDGLPTKVADGAHVRSLAENTFVSNLDTFGGNSGSPVINVLSGEVEGILVRGETDYDLDPVLNCKTPHHCPDDGCSGETSTSITKIGLTQLLKHAQQ